MFSVAERPRPWYRRKKYIISLVVILLVAGAAGAAWYLLRPQPTTPAPITVITARAVCSDELMARANSPINDNSGSALSLIVDDIKKLPNHNDDPNCVYVLARFALMTGDGAAARTQLERLKYFDVRNYNRALQPVVMSLEDIENAVVVLEKRAQSMKKVMIDYNEIDKAGQP